MKPTPKPCSCTHNSSPRHRLLQHWANRRLRHYANTVLRRLAETSTVEELLLLAAPRASR
jgi:hypothetical protein